MKIVTAYLIIIIIIISSSSSSSSIYGLDAHSSDEWIEERGNFNIGGETSRTL